MCYIASLPQSCCSHFCAGHAGVGVGERMSTPRIWWALPLPSEGRAVWAGRHPSRLCCHQKLHSPELKFRSAGRKSGFDLEKSTQPHSPGREAHRHQPRGLTHPPSGVETATKCKTDEPFKDKVIYIVEAFRASRNLKRFITWGTKRMILASSHSEGTDVF